MSKKREVQVALMLSALAIVIACVSLFLRPSSGSQRSESALARIRGTSEIRAGWAPYAPYCSLAPESGEPEGFYIDLMAEAAKEADLKVVWVETTWGNMIADLKIGKFDVMAAPVFQTIPRAKEVAFTRTIDYFGLSAVSRASDSRFRDLEDLAQDGLKVAVTQGEVGHEFALRHLPKAELVVHNTGDISLALVDVIQGRADIGICDAWTAKQFVAEHSNAVTDVFEDRPFNNVGAGWFVHPDEAELLQFLSTSIDWLESTGFVDKASKEYELPSMLRSP